MRLLHGKDNVAKSQAVALARGTVTMDLRYHGVRDSVGASVCFLRRTWQLQGVTTRFQSFLTLSTKSGAKHSHPPSISSHHKVS